MPSQCQCRFPFLCQCQCRVPFPCLYRFPCRCLYRSQFLSRFRCRPIRYRLPGWKDGLHRGALTPPPPGPLPPRSLGCFCGLGCPRSFRCRLGRFRCCLSRFRRHPGRFHYRRVRPRSFRCRLGRFCRSLSCLSRFLGRLNRFLLRRGRLLLTAGQHECKQQGHRHTRRTSNAGGGVIPGF